MRPTVILLTFNSESTLGATIESARRVAGEIFVVDSFSSDGTVELARETGRDGGAAPIRALRSTTELGNGQPAHRPAVAVTP